MVNTSYKGNDKVLIGFILPVLTFWFCTNSMMNVSPLMSEKLSVDSGTMNVTVSLITLLSGIFIVLIGGLADSIGHVKNYPDGNLAGYCRFTAGWFGFLSVTAYCGHHNSICADTK